MNARKVISRRHYLEQPGGILIEVPAVIREDHQRVRRCQKPAPFGQEPVYAQGFNAQCLVDRLVCHIPATSSRLDGSPLTESLEV